MRPWDKPRGWRLGAKIGVQHSGTGHAGKGLALGWAVIQMGAPVLRRGEEGALADPVDELIRCYRSEAMKDPNCEGVTLYRYGSKEAFALSVAASEGMSHEDHNAMIDRALDKLGTAGIPVIVEIVK